MQQRLDQCKQFTAQLLGPEKAEQLFKILYEKIY
jgi:hypothetical protein